MLKKSSSTDQDEVMDCLGKWSKKPVKIRHSPALKSSNRSSHQESAAKGENIDQSETDSRSIFLRDIPSDISLPSLEDHFKDMGSICRITMISKQRKSGTGYAYVEFATKASAERALELDGSILRGHKLQVARKRTNVPRMRVKNHER